MGMRFYIQEDSAGSDIMDEAKDALLLHGGAIAESVNHATHILVDTIADPPLLKGSQNNLPTPAKRTSKWVLECCRMRTTVWPLGVFEWKCWDFLAYPQHGIPPVEGVNTFVITLTGYTGLHREILKRLIEKSGTQYTFALTRSNTHLLCNTPTSKKAIAAKNWGVKVVNHLWIMDSMLTWTWQPCDKYTRSGQDIMTERGIWTLLDEATLKSGTVLPHPRLGVWPFPKDVNAVDESEIAGRPSRPKSPVVPQQRTTLQPLSASEQVCGIGLFYRLLLNILIFKLSRAHFGSLLTYSRSHLTYQSSRRGVLEELLLMDGKERYVKVKVRAKTEEDEETKEEEEEETEEAKEAKETADADVVVLGEEEK
jgi:hypothetical protein